MADHVDPAAVRSSPRSMDGRSSTIHPNFRKEVRRYEEIERERKEQESRKKRAEEEARGIIRELMGMGCPRESIDGIASFAKCYYLGRQGKACAKVLPDPTGLYICINFENRYFPYVLIPAFELMRMKFDIPVRKQALTCKVRAPGRYRRHPLAA